eukprot:9008302-Alexandrium_andersonii.AAC.1
MTGVRDINLRPPTKGAGISPPSMVTQAKTVCALLATLLSHSEGYELATTTTGCVVQDDPEVYYYTFPWMGAVITVVLIVFLLGVL